MTNLLAFGLLFYLIGSVIFGVIILGKLGNSYNLRDFVSDITIINLIGIVLFLPITILIAVMFIAIMICITIYEWYEDSNKLRKIFMYKPFKSKK